MQKNALKDLSQFPFASNHRQFVSAVLSIKPFNQFDSRQFFTVCLTHIFSPHTRTREHTTTHQVNAIIFCISFPQKFRATTVEMEPLNGNLAIFHMQNSTKKTMCIQISVMLHADSTTQHEYVYEHLEYLWYVCVCALEALTHTLHCRSLLLLSNKFE